MACAEGAHRPRREQPRPFTTDGTEEGVSVMVHEREGAVAVMSGEGRPVFDARPGRYSGDGRTGDVVYLTGISGGSWQHLHPRAPTHHRPACP